MATDRSAFGTLLRRMRLEANVSQETLAERARISKQAIGALERGSRRSPQRQTLVLLADALELDASRRAELEGAARASAPARVRHSTRDDATPAPPAPPRSVLPIVPTSFVGREAAVAQLAAALTPGWCTTVWGSGGIGKTRLALETARAYESRYDAVWFAALPDVDDEGAIVQTIAAAVDVHEEAQRPIADSLTAALNGKNALLILDNAEQVVHACARVVERLAREVPTLTMLCTSREALRIGAERVVPLDPLPVPNGNDAALAANPAVRLFLDRAEFAGARIDADRDLSAIAEICSRLDAIPLALELAAARAPLMRPAQIVDALDDRFRLLTRGVRTARAHQQTLLGTLGWSVDLLPEAERIVLRRLCVWPNVWTLDDAVAVAADDRLSRFAVIDAVSGLIDRSLIVVEPSDSDERDFRLLQTTRSYATDCAVEAGELARCERLQAERVRDVLAHNRAARERGEDRTAHIDVPALRAALRWCITLGHDLPLGAVIAGSASHTWVVRNMELEGMRWIDDALAAIGDDSAEAIPALLARARILRGQFLFPQTYETAQRAFVLAEREGDVRSCAEAQLCMGFSAAIAVGETLGHRLLDEAATRFRALGDRRGELLALSERAAIPLHFERFAESLELLEPLVDAFYAIGDSRSAILTAGDVGDAKFSLGDTPGAIAQVRRVLAQLRRLNSALPMCNTLQNLTAYVLDTGDIPTAMTYAAEAFAIAEQHGYHLYLAMLAGHVADALAASGDFGDAAVLLGFVDRQLRADGVDRAMETERRGRRRVIERCTAALGAAALQTALDDGAALSAEEAHAMTLDAIEALREM